MKKSILFLLTLFCFSTVTLFAAEEDEIDPALLTEELEAPFDEEALIAAVDNLGPTASGFLGEGDFGPEDETFLDPRVLRDFIESRGLIECRKKQGTLTIAGDVRARWISAGEKVRGDAARGFRGSASSRGVAVNRYKSEVNLFLDYVAPRAWVSTKLKWVNFDGKDGGTATKTEMDRAFIGYDIYHDCDDDFYIEIGRSNLGLMFESRVEFTAVFDGVHIYFTKAIPNIGQFTTHGGPFIIDSYSNHYGWIAEAALTEWIGTGLGFIYTIIDWGRNAPTLNYGNLPNSGRVAIRDNPRYRFLVSQMLFGYERKIDFIRCKTLYVYGAVLVNHDAKRSFTTGDRYLNHAWYAGFTLGKLCKCGDWSVDINYQSVQVQAVPEFDLAGIGHGNAANVLFSDAIIQGFAPNRAQGFTNYKGWEFSLLFAMTDSLSLRSKAQFSVPRNRSVGGDFRYKSFEMSVIYAF